MANNGRFEYTIGFKTDDSGLKEARKALQEIQNLSLKPETGSKEITEYNSKILDAKESASRLEAALTNAFNIKMGSTSVQALNQELKKLNLNDIYTKMKAIGPEGESAFNKIALQAMQTNLQIKKGNTLLDKFGKTLWRNVEWLISGNLINTVTGVFTKAYGYTKNLDESLNNIRIVTGKGADEMARFGKEAQETAAKLGKGTTDITNASLIFYQQGLDKAEVNARTEVATKLANVSQQSAETTADQLTAVWNGFQAGTDELERYADVMTAIAASTASSSSELAGAISKVSSVAHTTGVDMEQLSAMISTVISVTRDSPETVGTAFKTIFARMDDLVEDGTDEFGVSLGRVSSHLAAMGIEILNEDGSLRDLGDTLTETGNKWSSYSREQQVAIAEQMGGKRQWNQVIALFDNWDKYKDALDVARNSTGALQEQQDTYMESTQAHLQAVKTAWEGVYGEMMTADNINTVADAFTKILNQVQSFIEALGGIKPILLTVSSLMVKSFSGQIAQGITNAANNIKIMGYNAAEMKASQELSTTFNIKDNKLLADLTPKYAALLKQKKAMNEEDIKRFSAYAKAREELNYQQQSLEKQLKTEEEIINKYNSLTSSYAEQNKDISKMSPNDFTNIKEIGQNLQSGKLDEGTSLMLDVGNKKGGSSAPTQMLEEQNRLISEQIALTIKQKEAIQTKFDKETDPIILTALQEEYDKFDNVEQVLRGVNGEIKQYASNGKVTTQQLAEMQAKLSGVSQELNPDKYAHFINQIDKMGSSINEIAIPAETGAKQVENLISEFQRMGSEGALTTEQTDKLVKKYTELKEKLEQNPDMSLDDVRRELQSAAEIAKKVGGEVVKDMDLLISNSQKNIRQDLEGIKNQVKNFEKEYNDILSNVTFKNFIQSTANAVSAVGQLVSSFNSIKNAINIWDNDGLSGWDKFTQITQNLTMALPMLVSAFLTLKTGVIDQAKAVWGVVRAKVALSGMTEAQHAEAIKEIIDREALSGVTLTEAGAEKILIKERIAEIGVIGLLKKARLALMATNPFTLVLVAGTALLGLFVLLSKAINKFIGDGSKAGIAAKNVVGMVGIAISTLLLGPFGGIAAVIALIIKKVIELSKALKEKKEAFQRTATAAEELKKKNVELRATIEDNIKAFNDFEEVWENFQKGTATINEVKNAFQSMAEQLGIAEDEEYQRLMRIANYTKDYAPLEEYLDKIIEKQRQVATGTYSQDADANRELLGATIEDFNPSKRNKYGTGTMIHGIAAYQAGAYIKDEGIEDILIKTGVAKNVTHDNFQFAIETGEINEKTLEQLLQYREKFEEMKNSENKYLQQVGTYYIDLMDRVAGTINTIQESDIQAMAAQSVSDFQPLKGKNEKEKQQDFGKQLNELEKQGQNEFFQQHGIKMTDEQKKQLHDTILSEYAKAFPKNEEFVTKIETEDALGIEEIFKQAAKDAQKGKDPLLASTKELKELSVSELNKIKETLENNDIDFSTINMQTLAADSDFLAKIISQRGQLEQEDIEKFKQYQIETKNTADLLTSNYTELIDSYDNFSKSLEKGTVSDRNIKDNKQFQGLMEAQDELKAFYGSTSAVGEAIDILNSDISVGSEKWQKAWKTYGEALEDAEIQQQLNDIDHEINNLSDAEISADAESFYNTMDNILGKDYSIEVEIEAKLKSNIESVISEAGELSDQVGKISEGFTIASSDISAFVDYFGAAGTNILNTAAVTADGTIQLNQQAVEQAVEAKKKEIEAEYEAQIQKIQITNSILEHKKATYEKMLDIANQMAEGEYQTDVDLKGAQTQLQDYADDIALDDEAAMVVAKGVFQQTELTQLASFYANELNMEADYQKKRKEIIDNHGTLDTNYTADSFSAESGVLFQAATSTEALKMHGTTVAGKVNGESAYYLSEEAIAAQKELGKKLASRYQGQINQIDSDIASNNELILKLQLDRQASLSALDSSMKSLTSSTEDNTDATEDNTDATEDNAEAQQELLDLLNEEIDAYHDVTQQIERHTTALNRLQKAQEKATGKTLIKNLQDQMKAYQDLNNDYADKQLLQYEEAAVYRVQLEEQGVTFDENGVISNYSDILNQKQKEINADLSWYNSLSAEDQEAQKDWIESRQAEYDSLVDLIGNYDQLWNQDIPDLADEIAENIDKQVELELEIKKQIVQIEVDKGSLKRMEMELNKTLDNVQEKDLERNLAYNIQSYFTYSDEEKAKLKRYLEAKQKKDEADTSGEDLSAADLENYREALEDYNSIMQEKAKQANEIISSAFDGLNEKIERQKTQFETMSKLFEHDMNLIKLRYGDQAFEQLKTLYAAREENAKAQLSNANLALEVAQKELAAAQAKGDLDLVQAAQDKVTSALEAQRQAVIDNINAIQDTATNAVDAIFAHLDEQVAGVSFEKMKKQWDDMEKDSADYYDAINGAYEIEKLRTNMKKAINESGSAATQKALNNLMNEEITKLQQKDKLSKYDIERANALFDIEQKRAAFREAQNNKSKMRLRRDTSGNYSYQFVSDEDKVTSAMQDLADAQNQLYNIDKEAYKNNLEKMQEYYLEYQEEMKAAANASAEERQAIEDRYMERIAELQEENGDISRNLIQDVVNDSEILTGKSIENIEDMTQAEVDALMGSIIPAWESYLGVMSRSKDLLADMKQAGLDASQVFDTSKAKIDIEMALNGLSWDSLIEGFDPAIENIKTMTSSTDEIAQEVKNISAGVSQFIEAIKSNSFTEELEKFVMALENGTLITPANIGSAINILPQRNAYISSDNIDTTVDSITNLMDRIITSYTQLKGEEARIRRDQLIDNGVIFDADGIINNYAEIIKQKQLGLSADLAWYSSSSGEDQEIQKDWIESRQVEYDNLMDLISGYDQLWNRDIPTLTNEITKIAEEKTSNDLQGRISDLIDNSMFVSETVQFLADRLSKVYSQQSEILSETMDYLHTLSAAKEKERELQEYQPTVVNINADFPAVTSQYEIEQALDSLVARATQRAYRTIR